MQKYDKWRPNVRNMLAIFIIKLVLVTLVFDAGSWASQFVLFDALSEVKVERTGETCELVFGSVPIWLNGYFLRQTSGSWGTLSNAVPQRIENFYDSIGMGSVYRITGAKQQTVYSNRYYRALPYQIWNVNGRSLNKSGVAFWTLYSQTSVNVEQGVNSFPGYLAYSPSHTFWKLGTQVEAVSQGTYGTRIDVNTMENDGKAFPFADAGNSFGLDGLMFDNAAHAVDDKTGTLWSAVYNANPSTGKTRLIVYQIVPTGTTAKRQLYAVKDFPQFSLTECSTNPSTPKEKLAEYRDVEPLPGYVHDIAVTKNYVIVPTSSMLADFCFMFVYKYWPAYVFSPLHSFWYKWRPDKYSTVQILNKVSKKFYEVRIQPLFIAHVINAFEDQVTGTIVLDVVASNDGNAYMLQCSTISSIINNNGFTCSTRVERIIIDIPDSAASRYRLTQVEWNFYEKPRINPKYAGQYYTQAYMISKWMSPGQSAVVKLNTRTTEISQWVPDENYMLDEVVFVPNPSNRNEEDGVLLVAGQNLNNNRGFVIILDAATLKKIAEIGAPDSTPPGGHSQFYFNTDLGMSSPLMSSSLSRYDRGNHFSLLLTLVLPIVFQL